MAAGRGVITDGRADGRKLEHAVIARAEDAGEDRERDQADELQRDAAQPVDQRLLADLNDVSGLAGRGFLVGIEHRHG